MKKCIFFGMFLVLGNVLFGRGRNTADIWTEVKDISEMIEN
jgi:hypothetical protein